MNPEDQITKPESELEELDIDSAESVDDFIKELEAKERDLHITADLSIEIEESDFDVDDVPAFVADEITAPPVKAPAVKASPAKNIEQRSVPQGSKTRVYELEQEVARLNARITELRMERDETQENSDRRLKDFQNFKYRIDRERRGSFIDQLGNLATQMLPVLDNLDRALAAAESSTVARSPEFQQFYEGIILVNQQVNEVLSEMGVSPISTLGEPFDPAFHEAVAIVESDAMAPNTVFEEMLRGFRIGNKVIRHSMVKVTQSPNSSQPASESAPAVAAIPVEDTVAEIELLAGLNEFELSNGTPASPDASSKEAE
ncbi:MAG: nucleotide exchange factor GrpE [Pyrinomonadaceae bacterium]